MPNTEHLSKLKEGVRAWNTWRAKNPDIQPNLSWADLGEANLKGADLSGTYLGGTNLSKANLSGANLRMTYLRKANLKGADLSGSALRRADIRGADLRFAIMKGTRLRAANLNEADLTDAYMEGANFEAADLRGAENLSIEQLSKALTLYEAALDPVLKKHIEKDYPHLLDKPEPVDLQEIEIIKRLKVIHATIIVFVAGALFFGNAPIFLGIGTIPSVAWWVRHIVKGPRMRRWQEGAKENDLSGCSRDYPGQVKINQNQNSNKLERKREVQPLMEESKLTRLLGTIFDATPPLWFRFFLLLNVVLVLLYCIKELLTGV